MQKRLLDLSMWMWGKTVFDTCHIAWKCFRVSECTLGYLTGFSLRLPRELGLCGCGGREPHAGSLHADGGGGTAAVLLAKISTYVHGIEATTISRCEHRQSYPTNRQETGRKLIPTQLVCACVHMY